MPLSAKTMLLLEGLVEEICEYERCRDGSIRARLRESCWIKLEDVLQSVWDAEREKALTVARLSSLVGEQKPAI